MQQNSTVTHMGKQYAQHAKPITSGKAAPYGKGTGQKVTGKATPYCKGTGQKVTGVVNDNTGKIDIIAWNECVDVVSENTGAGKRLIISNVRVKTAKAQSCTVASGLQLLVTNLSQLHLKKKQCRATVFSITKSKGQPDIMTLYPMQRNLIQSILQVSSVTQTRQMVLSAVLGEKRGAMLGKTKTLLEETVGKWEDLKQANRSTANILQETYGWTARHIYTIFTY